MSSGLDFGEDVLPLLDLDLELPDLDLLDLDEPDLDEPDLDEPDLVVSDLVVSYSHSSELLL